MTSKEEYILSIYKELTLLGNHNNIKLVQNNVNGTICVKKELENYNLDLYRVLKEQNISGVPKIYELIEKENKLIVIEEFINGKTLDEKYSNKCDIITVKKIVGELCDILTNLHNLTPPIIHRDIKPSNIIISNEDKLYLIDFNISRLFSKEQNKDTVIMGTSGYASPEQCGFAQTDARSDIFSIGMLMSNMIDFDGNGDKKELEIKHVINKCIAIDPENRYKNIDELKKALFFSAKSSLWMDGYSKDLLKSRIKLFRNNWRDYLPPGFRSGKIYKMIIAVLGYALIFCFSMMMETNNKNSTDKFQEDIAIKCATFLAGIVVVFTYCNWRNIKRKIPLLNRENMSLRVIGYVIYPFVILIVCCIIAAVIVVII